VLNRKMPTIPEDEIDEALQEFEADVGKPEYRISEIFLPIESAAREDETRRSTAELLAQIRGGVPFAAAAREFSRGATAENGGGVGWVRPDQLASEIGQILRDLDIGEISEPIRTSGGFYLITLHERRRFMATDPSEVKIALRQISLDVADGASTSEIEAVRRRAAQLAASAGAGCQGLEALASVQMQQQHQTQHKS